MFALPQIIIERMGKDCQKKNHNENHLEPMKYIGINVEDGSIEMEPLKMHIFCLKK